MIGSGQLAQTVMANDLVDEYRLLVYPIVLGSGKRLFRDGSPRIPLQLVDGSITPKGVPILTYRPEGKGSGDLQAKAAQRTAGSDGGAR